MSSVQERVERLLADGSITQQDADEMLHFEDFLENIAGKPKEEQVRIYLEMYPDDQRAVS